jgi:hypothetical protein
MALGWKEPFQLGLKQKFCFSRKKLTKSYKNFHENFRENKNSCEKWRGKQKYRKKSKFQEANEVSKLKECSGPTDPGNVQKQMRKTM